MAKVQIEKSSFSNKESLPSMRITSQRDGNVFCPSMKRRQKKMEKKERKKKKTKREEQRKRRRTHGKEGWGNDDRKGGKGRQN